MRIATSAWRRNRRAGWCAMFEKRCAHSACGCPRDMRPEFDGFRDRCRGFGMDQGLAGQFRSDNNPGESGGTGLVPPFADRVSKSSISSSFRSGDTS
jgi:hypothetical protein